MREFLVVRWKSLGSRAINGRNAIVVPRRACACSLYLARGLRDGRAPTSIHFYRGPCDTNPRSRRPRARYRDRQPRPTAAAAAAVAAAENRLPRTAPAAPNNEVRDDRLPACHRRHQYSTAPTPTPLSDKLARDAQLLNALLIYLDFRLLNTRSKDFLIFQSPHTSLFYKFQNSGRK